MKLYAFAYSVHVNTLLYRAKFDLKVINKSYRVITPFIFFLFFKVHNLEINVVINTRPRPAA